MDKDLIITSNRTIEITKKDLLNKLSEEKD